MSAEETIKTLGMALPEPPAPIGAYLPAIRSGNLLFLSGVLPIVDGRLAFEGKLGLGLGIDEGYEAAGIACLNALAIVKKELGSLDKVKRIVKVTGYVASSPGFYDQPKVVNGASELLQKVFGNKGKHARAAVGCPSLPADSPVEVEMIVEVEEE
ncbi:MAG: RidA family protein [Candidatus Hydrothermarchaeales archaeon]